MKIQIYFGEPIIPSAIVQQISPNDLNVFYCTASDFEKTNIFFMLLTSMHHYEDQGLFLSYPRESSEWSS